jgi:3-deoxy-D-manno-octulosonate 8-phosphate phosphatase KdsC-like HAD superfamily phosphatase
MAHTQQYKSIWFDFDGIFSKYVIFNDEQKIAKTMQYGARHAITMLQWYGFTDINIITGDSTDAGKEITKRMLRNFDNVQLHCVEHTSKYEYIAELHNIMYDVIYVGDDLHDMIFATHCSHFITHKNAHDNLRLHASYVSSHSSDDYLVMDIAIHILHLYNINEYSYLHSKHNDVSRLLYHNKQYTKFIAKYSMANKLMQHKFVNDITLKLNYSITRNASAHILYTDDIELANAAISKSIMTILCIDDYSVDDIILLLNSVYIRHSASPDAVQTYMNLIVLSTVHTDNIFQQIMQDNISHAMLFKGLLSINNA